MLRNAFIYGYNDKLSGFGLILCPFNSIRVVVSLVGPMFCLSLGSWPNIGDRYGAHLVEQGFIPIRKLLVIPTVYVPLMGMSCKFSHCCS